MRGTGLSGSTGPRRQSRWGGAAPASAPAVTTAQPSVTTAPPPPVVPTVSDQDALQALLSEVSAKEQEQAKQKAAAAAAAQSKDSNLRRGRPLDNDGARDGTGSSSKRPKRQQDDDGKNSYYGPSGGGSDGNEGGGRGAARDEKETDATGTTAVAGPPTAKPNFGLSGALAKDISRSGTAGGSRMYKGVLLKFQEPPEARAPVTQWRLYVYKSDTLEQTLHISKQSAYLIGRSPDICDIVTAHASCSTQHAVLQYRALPVPKKSTDGSDAGTVLHCQPYLLDLESTNGTFLNGVKLDAARYYQCKTKDVLRFGASTREYVLLC
jgi:smad nuclear-interacting protein 1